MADIRINALAGTATSAASDDYLALDGAANGTRKILASNIAQNVSDVVLGTNGPSVKSSLDARAARQGLVFDGTAGSTVSGVAAFGTSDFSVAGWINPTIGAAALAMVGSQNNGFVFSVLTDGTLRTAKENVANNTASSGTVTSGKDAFVVYSRSGTTGTYYINGVAAGTTTDSNDYSVAVTQIGSNGASFANKWSGKLAVLAYNRALSASEVVSLFEAGVPSGADYNSASNTTISTSALTAFLGYSLYSTFTSANGTSFSAQDASGSRACATNAAFNVTVGQRILVTFTFTQSGSDLPQVILCSTGGTDSSNAVFAVAGSNSILLTATRTDTVRVRFFSFNAANYSVSSLSVTRQGLLLAPDAAQAGGGLTWYDTSGNAASITLPASGVTWNVPNSGTLASGLTNGNVSLVPNGTGDVRIIGGSNSTLRFYNGSTQKGALFFSTADGALEWNDGTNTLVKLFSGGAANSLVLSSGGNTLLGTATDSSNGKLQLATHTTSAGGIGFGTDVSLYRTGTGILWADRIGGPNVQFAIAANGTAYGQLTNGSSANLYVDALAGSMVLRTNGSTTALTLDSSQRVVVANATNNGSKFTMPNNTAIAWNNAANSGDGGSVYFDNTNALQLRTGSGASLALTLDSSQNATFAGRIGLTASGTNPIYSNFIPAANSTYAGLITMQAGGGSSAYGGALQLYGHSHASKPGWVSANISQGSSGKFAVNNSGLGGGTDVFTVDTNGNGSFSAALSIGNTVTAAVGIASTHKVTMVIGGVTYYLLASNV